MAEDITSRFLNVVSLFNGTFPLIAIQMQLLQVGDHTTLVFTTIMDELSRGLVDEDEDAEAAPSDRAYWENRATKETVALVDDMLERLREIDPTLNLKYNKFYIGLAKAGQTNNFSIFRPQKNGMRLEVRLKRSEEFETQLDDVGLDMMDYDNKWSRYRIRLTKEEIEEHSEFLKQLLQDAYKESNA